MCCSLFIGRGRRTWFPLCFAKKSAGLRLSLIFWSTAAARQNNVLLLGFVHCTKLSPFHMFFLFPKNVCIFWEPYFPFFRHRRRSQSRPSTRGFGGEKLRGEKSFVYGVSWSFGGSHHKLCHNTVDIIRTNRKDKNPLCHQQRHNGFYYLTIFLNSSEFANCCASYALMARKG